jgi:hypothetical protein
MILTKGWLGERKSHVDNQAPDDSQWDRDYIDTIEAAWQERDTLKESLERAKNYDPYSSRACPLCTYEQGTLLKVCNLHQDNELNQLRADAMVLALRLMGESETSFAPETHEVMTRWRVKCLKLIGDNAKVSGAASSRPC